MTPPTHHHPGRSAAEGAARRFHAVLDTHFLGSDPAPAASAIAKLEKGKGNKNPRLTPNWLMLFRADGG
jgi:hypothetical protein